MTRNANAEWNGDLKTGKGTMTLGSGAFSGPYSFQSRMENGAGTNPEELIGAAHAGCFSMQLSAMLAHAGYVPDSVKTVAKVQFGPSGGGFSISGIDLTTEAAVPGLSDADFQKLAADAKTNCPISKALAAVPITLDAKLV